MKKRILVAIGVTGLLTTGLLAQGFMSNNCGNGMYGGKMHMGKNMGMNQNLFGFGFLNGINLSKEQINQISILQNEMRLEMGNVNNVQDRGNFGKYFNEKSFDKNLMIKERNNFSNEMLNIKANYMEKIYNTLTDDQKKIVVENIKMYRNF